MRIGVLGAARITHGALIAPASRVPGVTVAAIAAREPERARAAAHRHGIPRVHDTYAQLLADDSLDAVYVPLPAALHGTWTRAALSAGKHVLVEKPFTANAAEAEEVAAAAAASGLVVMEAHHPTHHPFTTRIADVISTGTLGPIQSATATFCVPLPPGRDIRWNFALGGGGLMDVGCYPLRMLRDILGADPTVDSARAAVRGDIDRLMIAQLTYGSTPVTVISSIWSRRLLSAQLEVRGEHARMRVRWPYHPQQGGALIIDGPGIRVREKTERRSSYDYQLEAFRDAVEHGGANRTDATAAIRTMRTIDETYWAAGMRPREPFAAKHTRRQDSDASGRDDDGA
ncbi:Gfo/Idh/MocA family oxidoreductase [Microbacterium sp. PRC9]|uniref:Gfo/Idh/MocA family protein n=1 Tax=Microbacterium sp. PRC9 TaxID=2962591 RepID=UPI002882C98F|nr:Gfo/Idh/MocA family oxidoreductase [Microbacterium sp. PRC9]MDT0144565.1 Gfo/Idh/MocA family oxidoreductase [Microbacterium sp. PRC9]